MICEPSGLAPCCISIYLLFSSSFHAYICHLSGTLIFHLLISNDLELTYLEMMRFNMNVEYGLYTQCYLELRSLAEAVSLKMWRRERERERERERNREMKEVDERGEKEIEIKR